MRTPWAVENQKHRTLQKERPAGGLRPPASISAESRVGLMSPASFRCIPAAVLRRWLRVPRLRAIAKAGDVANNCLENVPIAALARPIYLFSLFF